MRWGFPFGNPQFLASVRLPEAYRSLARPFSAPEPSYSPDGTVATVMIDRSLRPDETGPVSVWIARTHGLIHTSVDCGRASTLPTRAYTEWCIGSAYPNEPRFPLKGLGSSRVREVDPLGFEPRASSLQRRHSTTELWARAPRGRRFSPAGSGVRALAVHRCPIGGPSNTR